MTKLAIYQLLVAGVLAGLRLQAQPSAISGSDWVHFDPSGKLVNQVSPKGDRIPDFSHAGYRGGGIKLPSVLVRKTVMPSGKDDSGAIQQAIDEVAEMPVGADGFRGAVQLAPGTFHCAQPLSLSQGGIVLRGAGENEGGTSIEMTGGPHICIEIKGDTKARSRVLSRPVSVTNAYVPVGACHISAQNADGLKSGDVILIRRPVTAAWIHFMGMDQLFRSGRHQTWIRAGDSIAYERTIRALDGNRLTLDVPLPDAIDKHFLDSNVATIVKIIPTWRVAECGVESLRIVSPPPRGTLAANHNLAMSLHSCEDCWFRDVTMIDALGNVQVGPRARRITMESLHAVHSATVAKGAGYSADFSLRGSQILVDRCTSVGDGSFYVATMDPAANFNVVLNCNFEGNGSIQPHMRWSTALLVDSCKLPEGRIEFINRRTAGSGHGWAIGWAVAWNCQARTFQIQQPPGAFNWCIGCVGQFTKGSDADGSWLSSFGKAVNPPSLYLAQLCERLGPKALANIGY